MIKNVYDLLCNSKDGDLFSHDKISFIVDSNLDQYRKKIKKLDLGKNTMAQLARVRSNVGDYLECLCSKHDLTSDIKHVITDLPIYSDKQAMKVKQDLNFSDKVQICKGNMYF